MENCEGFGASPKTEAVGFDNDDFKAIWIYQQKPDMLINKNRVNKSSFLGIKKKGS